MRLRDLSLQSLAFSLKSLYSRLLTPAELKDVNFVVYHNWDNTRRFIDSIDERESGFVTSGEAMISRSTSCSPSWWP